MPQQPRRTGDQRDNRKEECSQYQPTTLPNQHLLSGYHSLKSRPRLYWPLCFLFGMGAHPVLCILFFIFGQTKAEHSGPWTLDWVTKRTFTPHASIPLWNIGKTRTITKSAPMTSKPDLLSFNHSCLLAVRKTREETVMGGRISSHGVVCFGSTVGQTQKMGLQIFRFPPER